MTKQSRKLLIFLILTATFSIIMYSCRLPSFWGDEKVADISKSEEYLIIDSDTILESLAQGKIDVFTPQLATPQMAIPTPSSSVRWSQADYFKIILALYKEVWNESLEGWKLERMLFRLSCSDVINGPQHAAIQFFKITHTHEQESRLLRDLWIDPLDNLVSWHEVEKYPNVWSTKTIDLTEIKIPAEEALRIAENNGGDKARSEVGEACVINLLLSPGAEYSGWQVDYYGKSNEDLFANHIDPLTGKFEILKPKSN